MTLIGPGFILTTHTGEIFDIGSKFIVNGLDGFKKDCAYKPTLSVNLEGYVNYRQEFYGSGSIPYSFTLRVLMTYEQLVKLISETSSYLEGTKGANPPEAWTLEDNRIKGVNKARTLTDLRAPLVFEVYKVVPVSKVSYSEAGELYGIVDLNLLEVR